MNGTTLFQTLYATYHDHAVAVSGQQSGQILGAIIPWMHVALGIYVIVFGIGMMQGRVDGGEFMSRAARAIIVISLIRTANWNQFVVQFFTTTIPDGISNAVAGGGGVSLQGAQGFDGLANAVDNFTAQVLAQVPHWYQIAKQLTVVLAGWFAKGMIFLTFVVWLTAQAGIAFLIPLGALLSPLALFRATEGYFARWIAQLVSLELVGALSLMLAAFVVQADTSLVKAIGHPVPAAAANQNLQLNGGDFLMTGMDVPGAPPAALGAAPPGNNGSTLNADMSIATLWNLGLSYAFGALLLIILTRIALHIGSSHGFTAAPAINAVIGVAQRGGALITRAGAAARR